jgi:glucose-6-phosphate 1-epimerase
MRVADRSRSLAVSATVRPTRSVWNPGPGASLPPDLDAGEWRNFLCVEAAVASAPMSLAPGAMWTAAQTLEALL